MNYECEPANCLTKQICHIRNDSDLYYEDSWFESRKGHPLSLGASCFS